MIPSDEQLPLISTLRDECATHLVCIPWYKVCILPYLSQVQHSMDFLGKQQPSAELWPVDILKARSWAILGSLDISEYTSYILDQGYGNHYPKSLVDRFSYEAA